MQTDTIRDEVESVLAGLLDVNGVDGVLAMDTDGVILGTLMPAVYDDELLESACGAVINVLTTLKELGIRADDIAFDYSGVSLVIRDLRHGHLVLLSQATISLPLLNIATNVARNKLTKLITPRAAGAPAPRKRAVPVAAVVAAGTEQSPEPRIQTVQIHMPETVGQSTGSMASSGKSTMVGSSAAALFHSLPPASAVFDHLLRALIKRADEANPTAAAALLESIRKFAENQPIGAPATAAIRDFVAAKGDGHILAPINQKDMSALVHQLYILLCERLGPIVGDQLVGRALRDAESLPQAREFSPYELM